MIVSCQQVIAYIEEEFSIEYSVSGVNKLLARLGCRFKQLSLFPSKLDRHKQDEFVAQYVDLESHLTDEQVILFMDGLHLQHHTSTCRVWSKIGLKK
ncbi:MAG: winged helix-turn-helix domain-containing protein [Bacteroidota bacterium]